MNNAGYCPLNLDLRIANHYNSRITSLFSIINDFRIWQLFIFHGLIQRFVLHG